MKVNSYNLCLMTDEVQREYKLQQARDELEEWGEDPNDYSEEYLLAMFENGY